MVGEQVTLDGYYATYADGTLSDYVSLKASNVAQNVQTGEVYTDLQEALNAAAKGQTVKLLQDVEAEDLYVGAGKTLDLNGRKLTVTSSLSASFTTSHIIDSSDCNGLLVIAEDTAVALNSQNAQLPVWTAEGARFVEIAYKQIVEDVADDAEAKKYRFYFNVADDSVLPQLLTEDCLTIRIKVSYTTASGMKAYQYFELTDELVAEYAAKWPNGTIDLTIRGAAGLQELSFTAQVVSTTADRRDVIISSAALSA